MDAELPDRRRRARVHGCRDLTAADMVRNTRTGTVTVDADARARCASTASRMRARPVERLAFSGSYLLG